MTTPFRLKWTTASGFENGGKQGRRMEEDRKRVRKTSDVCRELCAISVVGEGVVVLFGIVRYCSVLGCIVLY